MARVPVYREREVSLVAPRPGAEIDITQLTRGIGEGAAAFAKSIAIRKERIRRTDEQMKMVELDQQFMELGINTSKLRGRAAIGITDSLDVRREELRESYLSDVTDPITRANLEIYFDKSFNQHKAKTFSYELQQEDRYLVQADKAFRSNEMNKLNLIPVGDTESIEESISTMIVSQSIRQGKERWSKAVEKNYTQAVTNEAYVTQVSRWYKENPDLAYQWFNENEEMLKVKLSPEAYNTLNTLHANQYDDAETLRIYKEVRADYGGNLLAGANFLADPDNYEKYGIANYKHANAAGVMLRGAYNMEQALGQEKRSRNLENFSAEIGQWTARIAAMEDVAQRNESYDNLKRSIQTEPDLLPDERATWISNIDKAQYYTDPGKVNWVKEQIDNGEITEPYQIRMHRGDGIGKDTKDLEKYLADTNKAKNAGNGTNYIDRAEQDYLRRVRELSTPEQRRGTGVYLRASELEPFMLRLKATVRAEGLTAYSPKVIGIADDLMSKKAYLESTGEPVEERQFFRNEAERFGFQTPEQFLPSNVVQALRDIEQEGSTTQAGQQAQLSSTENDYTNLVYYNNNPAAIPGTSVDDKISFMDTLYERVYNYPMNDTQRETMRNNITYATGE